jgi:hypothetical protein
MKSTHLLALLGLAWGVAFAAEPSRKPATAQAPAFSSAAAKLPPVAAVTSTGPGQGGYVHYFVLTHPDESLEYQVGVELHDQRIAWSVPNAGVIVSEFIKKGTLNANGTIFKIEHLHGVRPFADEAQMRVLQKELVPRVAQWVDNETPYCLMRKPGEDFCLSCGDFVVRILYPGFSPLAPALPQDFARGNGRAHTTDDLLLYLVGIYNLPDKHAKLSRLATLNLPASMREDIAIMIEDGEPGTPTTTAVATAHTPAPPIVKAPSTTPVRSRIASRRQQNKKL